MAVVILKVLKILILNKNLNETFSYTLGVFFFVEILMLLNLVIAVYVQKISKCIK